MRNSIEERQKKLLTEVTANKINSVLYDRLSKDEQEALKNNLLELASANDYIISKVKAHRIVKLAIDLTRNGFDINPFSKELSLIPFKTKINNQIDYVAQPIIHLKGWQNKLYEGGFMLIVDKVWEINGKEKLESEMSFKELSLLDDTDKKYREKHFLGFLVVVEDLKKELPKQEQFMSYKYTKVATKNAEMPQEFELQGLIHKAVRRALNNMVIPKKRLNLIDAESITEFSNIKERPIETKKEVKMTLDDVEDKEVLDTTIEEPQQPTLEELQERLVKAKEKQDINAYTEIMNKIKELKNANS